MAPILTPDHRLEALDAGIRRMRGILEAGSWLTGEQLTLEDRRVVEWNLELALRDRANRRRRGMARHARA